MVYSFVSYPGSKSKVLALLYSYFPDSYDTFMEPFAGSYTVVLNNPFIEAYSQRKLSKNQLPIFMVNDIDDNIYALSKALLLNPERLFESNDIIYSNKLRKELEIIDDDDYIQRALKYLYAIRTTFGSLAGIKKAGFRYQVKQNRANPGLFRSKEFIKEIQKRLHLIRSFNEDWKHFLDRAKKYKHKDDTKFFIYLDPPYYHVGEQMYRYGTINHQELANYLKESEFLWLLSYENCKEVRELYKEFYQFPLEWRYSLSKHNNKQDNQGKELLIANYDPFAGKLKKQKLEKWL